MNRLKKIFASLRLCVKSTGVELPDEPSPAELDMIVDEARKAVGEGPAPRSPEQGVADMKARIAFLYKQKAEILNQEPSNDIVQEINRDIAEAEARLKEYETQKGSHN